MTLQYFNLRREARPLATPHPLCHTWGRNRISISDEKPGPWRRPHSSRGYECVDHFNLRREARPLATDYALYSNQPLVQFQSQTRSQAPGDAHKINYGLFTEFISISDEKPGPWRPLNHCLVSCSSRYFNLRREARPLATHRRKSS